MHERQAKGLCMFCDEFFSLGHQLKHKRSQIFVMECNKEKIEDESIEENGQVADVTSEKPQVEPTQSQLTLTVGPQHSTT